jgi:endonuclease/exonuclease/phosphatase family metal-dependent hydrolase
MPKSIRMPFYISLTALLAGFLLFPVAHAQGSPGAQNGTVKVMTYNVHEGSDYTEVLSAQTFDQFLAAVQITLDNVIASNPPLRMQAVAHQIAITQPDLVGLQEVTTWRVGPGPNPTHVEYDMLQELLDALQEQGLNYQPVVVVNEFQLQGPLPDLATYVSASNTDVLLARSDKGDLQLSNVQWGHFNMLLTLPTLIGPLTIERGWGSVDVALHGQSFRFIVTHIENAFPGVPATLYLQMAQAKELSDGPANTDLPVIIAGDFNADAYSAADGTIATYNEMLGLGFYDAWATVHPNAPGLTWQLVDSSPVDTAWQRIDFIFYRGLLNARTSSLAGEAPHDKIDGLWPSDHVGVRALLQLGQPQD